jgi:ATP-dependent HslUV protease ATP-binding subunit HslU
VLRVCCDWLQVENIGARRLHTVLERLIEDISFEAPDKVAAVEKQPSSHNQGQQPDPHKGSSDNSSPASTHGEVSAAQQHPVGQELAEVDMFYYEHVIDKQQVREKLQSFLKQDDLSKYIL